jgi:hypothetical protein
MTPNVPDQPHFDAESTPYFLSKLSTATEYLEFGSGGSTVIAARLGKKFTTVESDRAFLSAVENKIGPNKGRLIYVDIGKTKEWGIPKYQRGWPWRKWRWEKYASAPWHPGFRPELILVDGRFRVLCALYTIHQLAGFDFELLFDDYADREFYREVEKFAELKYFKGRMACFGPREFHPTMIKNAIYRYRGDWR